jgi:glyoxylase-like metal-dependent hydrolase (beta-lactamase superfamily II)/predicted ester cyclase
MADSQSEGASSRTKVEEAAANVRQARSPRRRITKTGPESVARRYFEAIGARELDAAVGLWAEGGRDNVRGQMDVVAPEGVRLFLGQLLDAVPDLQFEVLSTTTQEDRCAVQWRLTGTFAGPGSLNGIEPTGDRVTMEGIDLLTIGDGLIQANEAFPDSIALPRQIGMMPPQGSSAEERLTGVFNAKTRLSSRLSGGEAQLVAEGVWVVQGQPARCNVYLIEDEGGVTLFDAGARTMARAVARAGAKLGGIRRIVLGHGHTDHRGSAPALGAPVYCHPAEVQDAEGGGGFRYWPQGLEGIPFPHRQVQRLMHRFAWDGGPVPIAGTVSEGDEIAGFRVVEIPGHAPGQIALWRESDRLALSSDCFYTLDIWGRDSEPHLPFPTYNYDTEQARASMLKLAELEPAAAWPGHAKPITGDVRSQLQRAAAEG